MRIVKAIEILTSLERTLAPTMAASGTDAIKLGIEALLAIQSLRKGTPGMDLSRLPSETKE